MTVSLYEVHREEFEKIAEKAPSVAEMAKHFTEPRKMDRALGYSGSAVLHWISGRSGISSQSERAAKAWLIENVRNIPKAAKPDEAELLLVTCPPGVAAKAVRVLAVLGCEAVEV